MTLQPNEQVFYDADGIFISQYRFVTPDGSVYPTSTMQRVWGSVDRTGNRLLELSDRLGRIAGTIFFLMLSLVLFVLSWQTPLLLLIAFPIFFLSLWRLWRSRRNRRNRPRTRYWANFAFAGGGNFTGSMTSAALIDFSNSAPTAFRTHSERQADYAAWSYDEDWTRNLIAAANEAMLAARA